MGNKISRVGSSVRAEAIDLEIEDEREIVGPLPLSNYLNSGSSHITNRPACSLKQCFPCCSTSTQELLFYSLFSGELEEFKRLLDQSRFDVNKPVYEGYFGYGRHKVPLLNIACFHLQPKIVKLLCSRGALALATDQRGRTALWALMTNWLEYHFSSPEQDERIHREFPSFWGYSQKQQRYGKECLEALLEAKDLAGQHQCNKQNTSKSLTKHSSSEYLDSVISRDDGNTALHLAASCDAVYALNTLLSLGASPDGRGRRIDRRTPLVIASQVNAVSSAIKLLEHDADPRTCAPNGWTAAHYFCSPYHVSEFTANHEEVLRRLLPACANIQAHNDITPLHLAAKSGNSRMILILLEAGSDPTKIDKSGRSVIYDFLDEVSNVKQRDTFQKLISACKAQLPNVMDAGGNLPKILDDEQREKKRKGSALYNAMRRQSQTPANLMRLCRTHIRNAISTVGTTSILPQPSELRDKLGLPNELFSYVSGECWSCDRQLNELMSAFDQTQSFYQNRTSSRRRANRQ